MTAQDESPGFKIGQPIESAKALSAWLDASTMHGVFMIAQDKIDKAKLHVIVVNGDDDFLAVAGVCAMDFIEYVDRRLNAKDGEPKSRADRRRAKRGHH